MIYYGNELYHHGVLGQKWGVRRYQNPDGSYKAGAKGRYNSDETSSSGSGTKEKKHMSAETKKKIAVGVGVGAAVIGTVAVGVYLKNNPTAISDAKKFLGDKMATSISKADSKNNKAINYLKRKNILFDSTTYSSTTDGPVKKAFGSMDTEYGLKLTSGSGRIRKIGTASKIVADSGRTKQLDNTKKVAEELKKIKKSEYLDDYKDAQRLSAYKKLADSWYKDGDVPTRDEAKAAGLSSDDYSLVFSLIRKKMMNG